MNDMVNKHTRAGRDGKDIFCPNCMKASHVYHFAWSALMCQSCKAEVQKGEFLLAPQALENKVAFETMVSNMKQILESDIKAVEAELEKEAEKNHPWFPTTEKRLLGNLNYLKGKRDGLIYAECLMQEDRRK